MKDARLLLSLTEVIKIVRLASLLSDVLCLSSPKLRLRHGKQLAHLSLLNMTLNLCILSFVLSQVLLLRLPPLLISSSCSSPRESASVFADYSGSHFSVSQPKVLRNRVRGYLYNLHRAACLKESHSLSASSSLPLNFSRRL